MYLSDTEIRNLTPAEQQKIRELAERAERAEGLPMFLIPQAD
jgi:hypothetical protein